jgi:hypothetical protein
MSRSFALCGERESIAHGDAPAGAFACRQLEHDLGAALGRSAPGIDRVVDSEHDERPVEKDDVDREAHEEGMDRGGGPQQEAFARVEPITAQQAPQAGEGAVCELATPADHGPVGPSEDELSACQVLVAHVDVVVVIGEREGRPAKPEQGDDLSRLQLGGQ